jgi:glycosyltransferase involved in cell wall biosynthesis
VISVLIPNYNGKKFLADAISSALGQTNVSTELIVVDGGSTDGSIEILRSYGDRINWISEPDAGQSDALLKAFSMSKGNIIAWLNSDEMYFSEDTLNRVEDIFHSLPPSVGVVYGDFIFIDAEGKTILEKKLHAFNYRQILRGKFIPNQPSVFFRRCVLDELGFVSREYHYGMDLELYARIGLKYKFHYYPYLLGAFRIHSKSKTTAGIHKQRIREEVRRIQRQYDTSSYGWIFTSFYRLRGKIADLIKYRQVFFINGKYVK